ncbi:hypothetical protein L914_07355 [Phytophthora nicotianae]|uniref:Uncharacterized protein n=1 Tax=Phytophthora nicotianae TaxID=4792 RepID=W2NHJ2_PHYNI|nr:hypothetical protein L914_07355 [Phytophthora nicotianae]
MTVDGATRNATEMTRNGDDRQDGRATTHRGPLTRAAKRRLDEASRTTVTVTQDLNSVGEARNDEPVTGTPMTESVTAAEADVVRTARETDTEDGFVT